MRCREYDEESSRLAASALGWHYSNRCLHAWLLIPRPNAYFDVMIDRLHPSINLSHMQSLRETEAGTSAFDVVRQAPKPC